VSGYWSDLRDSIGAIVDYLWDAEEADYREQERLGDTGNHIFTDLQRVREWLEP
jgi:hypothetical protein